MIHKRILLWRSNHFEKKYKAICFKCSIKVQLLPIAIIFGLRTHLYFARYQDIQSALVILTAATLPVVQDYSRYAVSVTQVYSPPFILTGCTLTSMCVVIAISIYSDIRCIISTLVRCSSRCLSSLFVQGKVLKGFTNTY